MAGTDLQDSKRLGVSKSSPQKEGGIFKTGKLIEAKIKQLLQDACIVQSDASIWCMGDAERFADNNETIKIMATAIKNLLFFATRGTLAIILTNAIQNIGFIIKDIFSKNCIFN